VSSFIVIYQSEPLFKRWESYGAGSVLHRYAS